MKEPLRDTPKESEAKTTRVESFIQGSKVIERVLFLDDLKEQAKKASTNIMMGQTFDDGQPVDMLKYALFMMDLSDSIHSTGNNSVNCNWLLADHFITDINRDEEVQTVKSQMDKRISFLHRINEVYGGNIGIIFSSELCRRTEYQNNLNRLLQEVEENSEFADMVLMAVPEDRRGNPDAIRYPLEELATIQAMGTNIKIGPPYEIFYDQPARELGTKLGLSKYTAIHLKKAYPFGLPNSGTNLPKEIEEFGVLPYKINSKKMRDFRIDVFDNLHQAKQLIYSTTDQRPLLDLIDIATMAKKRLNREENQNRTNIDDICSDKTTTKKLQSKAFKMYRQYIYEPLSEQHLLPTFF